MEITITNQFHLFLIYLICGIIIGIFFDIFRILRKTFKTPDFITYIEDIIFGVFTGCFVIMLLFTFNNGSLRFYIFIALILGITIYFYSISKYFVKINVKIMYILKNILNKVFSTVTYPIKKIICLIKDILKVKIKHKK